MGEVNKVGVGVGLSVSVGVVELSFEIFSSPDPSSLYSSPFMLTLASPFPDCLIETCVLLSVSEVLLELTWLFILTWMLESPSPESLLMLTLFWVLARVCAGRKNRSVMMVVKAVIFTN